MRDWPWQESKLARRTRIARLYRNTLLEHAPPEAQKIDALLDGYGQHWITGNKPTHINPDEPMTAKEIADWTDTRINNVTNLIATHNITPVGKRNGRKTYWLKDFEPTPQDVAMR